MRIVVLVLAVFMLAISAVYATVPPIVIWSDDFDSYPIGALNNQGSWDNSVPNDAIIITGGLVMVTAGIDTVYVKNPIIPAYTADLIWFHTMVKGTAGGSDTMWSIYLDDPNGNNMARLYGTSNSVRGRIGGSAVITSSQPSISSSCDDVWDDIDVKINTVTNVSEFFLNGVSFGTLNCGAADAVGAIRIERVGNANATGSIWFDNMALGTVPEPSSLITLSIFGLGTLGMIKRRK